LRVTPTLEPRISLTILTNSAEALCVPTPTRLRALSLRAATQDLSANPIHFYAVAGPGLYDADSEVILLVTSTCGNWVINCEATPLAGDNGLIPSERIFVSSECADAKADEGGGAGFESLGSSRHVAAGAHTEILRSPLRFRLKTTWKDKAGTYTGAIRFTYLAMP